MTRSILFSVRLSTEWDRLRHSGQCTEPFWAAVLWMQDVQKLCWHLSDTGLVIRSKHIAHWSSSATDVSARERACIATRPLPSLTARMSDAATAPFTHPVGELRPNSLSQRGRAATEHPLNLLG